MNEKIVGLRHFFQEKENLYSYYLNTLEAGKTLAAIEEIDSLLDFINIQIELDQLGSVNGINDILVTKRPEKDLIQWLESEKEAVLETFLKATNQLIEILQTAKIIDPTIECYQEQTLDYVNFKIATNILPVCEKHLHMNDLIDQFNNLFSRLVNVDITALYKDAYDEIYNKLRKTTYQLPVHWMKTLTFIDRSVLETLGLWRINQEKRHIVFSKFGNANKAWLGGAGIGSENRLFTYLRNIIDMYDYYLIPDSNKESVVTHSLYMTPKLDNYLYLRDLRMNLTRKWARFTPLDMNHYLIKYYNDPYYWDDNHIFLDNHDLLRLGLAYYQYSMELGKHSSSFALIYKKALVCFRKSKYSLPDGLVEKLAIA